MSEDPANGIDAVRSFNRFYTKQIGVLEEGLLRSAFSLTEARLLYELDQRGETTATALVEALEINPGYASRLLGRLQRKGLLRRRPSATDGRLSLLSLTAKGARDFAELDAASRSDVAAMLEPLEPADRKRLVGALATVERLLSPAGTPRAPYLLRPPDPGDLGWVVHRHGALYAREWGYDETFEALVAEIAAAFVRDFDPKRERGWIAERDGENVGSVFLVRDAEADATARLRLLLVEPKARGLGIGRRLVDECIRFARQRGYQRIRLGTHDELVAARHIYASAGFRVVNSEASASFGKRLVAETWELALGPQPPEGPDHSG